MAVRWIEKTASTNSWLREREGEVAPMTLVCAREQTAGRGQRGNSWESEPGCNLTFSFHFVPEKVRPAGQFVISEAVALSITELLALYGIEAKVKWPNDIYVGDRKICGILIENSLMGDRISRCIVGVGLNVNQLRFVSDAPNPVSMRQLTGLEYDLKEMAQTLAGIFERNLARCEDKERIHAEYKSRLWRGEGEHLFREKGEGGSGKPFWASIADIALTGELLLSNGRRYAFKEVEFLLSS